MQEGNLWLVMNEDGRMLEREGGLVAVFRSMGAAADWAVGLRIRSGAFQVSKVAPSNRKAFEREVKFELSGAWEEDDGADDPLWMQWKREHEGSR
ncbi:unnamed protein product, partial [Choristocarpus tenellus]